MAHDTSLIWGKVLGWIDDYSPEDLFITLYRGRRFRVQGSVHVYDKTELSRGRARSRHYASSMFINIAAPSNQLRELARQAVAYIYERGASFGNCQVINKAGPITEFITNLDIHNNTRLEDALSIIKGLLLPFRGTDVVLNLGTRRDKDDIEVRGDSHVFTDGEVRVWSMYRQEDEYTFFYEVKPTPNYIIQVEPPTEEDEYISITVRAPQEYWAQIKRAVVSVVGRRNVGIGDLDKFEQELERQREEWFMKKLMREEMERRILPEWDCGDEYGEE